MSDKATEGGSALNPKEISSTGPQTSLNQPAAAQEAKKANISPSTTSTKSKEEKDDPLSSNPVLKKIARLLTNSSATDWKPGGIDLNAEARIPRPVQVHEFVYVRDLPEKSLVVRASTPVSCQYAAGGYKLTAITSGNYSIELRDRVFDPDKLVDPKFASNFKGKFLEVLATGEVARKLFEDVRDLVKGNTKNVQREFELKALNYFDTLIDSIEKAEITGWVREVGMVDGRDNTVYKVTHDGMDFIVTRSVEGWDAQYELRIKQGKFDASKIGGVPKLIFIALEKIEQENQLVGLEKKLRELGLEDDLT